MGPMDGFVSFLPTRIPENDFVTTKHCMTPRTTTPPPHSPINLEALWPCPPPLIVVLPLQTESLFHHNLLKQAQPGHDDCKPEELS